MQSRILKRSVAIGGHKTSVSLESEFWQALRKIATGRQTPLSHLIAAIGAVRVHRNLSSALRVFVVEYYRAEAMGQRPNAANAASRVTVDPVRENDVDATPKNT